jgi:acetyl-CoA carboxylase beta subunit
MVSMLVLKVVDHGFIGGRMASVFGSKAVDR